MFGQETPSIHINKHVYSEVTKVIPSKGDQNESENKPVFFSYANSTHPTKYRGKFSELDIAISQ